MSNRSSTWAFAASTSLEIGSGVCALIFVSKRALSVEPDVTLEFRLPENKESRHVDWAELVCQTGPVMLNIGGVSIVLNADALEHLERAVWVLLIGLGHYPTEWRRPAGPGSDAAVLPQ